MNEQIKQNRIGRLNERLSMVNEMLTSEQSKETPNTNRVNNLIQRKDRIQSRIDKFSE